jgi:chromate reductase
VILLLSGSLRAMSTNTALLRTIAATYPDAVLYDRMASLPHFDPDDDVEPLAAEVQHLRDVVDSADALIISMPEYAGAMPGSFKNALDWLVGSMALSGKPVAVVNVSAHGASKAQDSLRVVLGYLMVDLVEPASVHLPVHRQHVGDDGLVDDPDVRRGIDEIVAAVLDHVGARG